MIVLLEYINQSMVRMLPVINQQSGAALVTPAYCTAGIMPPTVK